MAAALVLAAMVSGASADPTSDLVGKSYQVETTPEGAVNVGIDFNRVGYGVIAPGRIIPATGNFPAYRIETLGDTRGIAIVVASRIDAHVSTVVDEWRVTATIDAPKVSSDSNLSYTCTGNGDTTAVVQFVYYNDQPRGRPIRKIAAAFALDRTTGALSVLSRPPQMCKATEDPL